MLGGLRFVTVAPSDLLKTVDFFCPLFFLQQQFTTDIVAHLSADATIRVWLLRGAFPSIEAWGRLTIFIARGPHVHNALGLQTVRFDNALDASIFTASPLDLPAKRGRFVFHACFET